MQRNTREIEYNFASGTTEATVATESDGFAFVGDMAFGGFRVDSEFDTDVITFLCRDSDGNEFTILTKTAATGWNQFTQTEIAQIGAANVLKVQTDTAVSAAATLYLKLKS